MIIKSFYGQAVTTVGDDHTNYSCKTLFAGQTRSVLDQMRDTELLINLNGVVQRR